MTNAVIIDPEDSVVTVIEAIPKGGTVTYPVGTQEVSLTAGEDIPRYHKMAVRAIAKGENIIKYGERIGFSTADIAIGRHVHTQNLDSIV